MPLIINFIYFFICILAVRFNDFGFIKSKNCVSLDARFVKFNYSSGNISSDIFQWATPLRQPPQL